MDQKKLKQKNKRVLHINIASSAAAIANEVLFKLFVLGHISTPIGFQFCRYNLKTTDTYFVELPVNISVSSSSDAKHEPQDVDDKFYFLAEKQGLPHYPVTLENNRLILSEKEQYVFKWLREFKRGNFRAPRENDPDFDHTQAPDVDEKEWQELLHEYCPEADGSMILTTNFIKYMHLQLEQVTSDDNPFLKNEFLQTPYLKQMVIESLILSSKDFSMRSYETIDEKDDNKGIRKKNKKKK